MVEFTYKNTTYVTNFANITQLKFMLNQEFKARFFSRETKRFHGDISQKWSKKNQVLTIIRKTCGILDTVEYIPVMEDGELVLRVNKRY